MQSKVHISNMVLSFNFKQISLKDRVLDAGRKYIFFGPVRDMWLWGILLTVGFHENIRFSILKSLRIMLLKIPDLLQEGFIL